MTRSWYEIKAKGDSAEVYIYDEIGLWGISASAFIGEIRGLKGKTLNVFINSPGGDVFDGIAIYNALKRHDAPVKVTVDALAASVASVITQAGSTRTMAKASTMMIHEPFGVAMGDLATMEKMAESLNLIGDNIADIYADRAGGEATEWRTRMAAETWYKAEEAVAAGLADEAIVATIDAAYSGRVFNLSKFNKVPEWVPQQPETTATWTTIPMEATTAETVQTSPEGQEDDMDETAIRQALGLDGEGDINAAITILKAAATDIATGEKGAENQLRKDNATLRQQLLTQESDYGQRILALEDRNRQKEAAYAVDSAIQAGRVAPKDRELALKLALNNAEDFEQFSRNLRVDLDERGRMQDAAEAALDLTREDKEIARQMGLTDQQMRMQKAREQGITLSS